MIFAYLLKRRLIPRKENPNPTNPPPAQLVMPNFALSPGGFGAGSNATNITCYFTVLEEYADFNVCYRSLFCAALMTIDSLGRAWK